MEQTQPEGGAGAGADTAPITATHLFVLQHGLHGSENDFANFERLVTEHLGKEGVHVHCATSNSATFFQTYDGIDQGGERLADEILALAQRMPNLKKLSLLGHSLGGLYARYCIGELFARGFFAQVEPVNFITMATPHLGIRRPQRGSVNFMYNSITKKLFHRTGQQFFLNDSASGRAHELSMNSVSTKPEGNAQSSVDSDCSGTLLVCTDAAGGDGELFEYYYCELRGSMLRLYEGEDSAASATSALEIDLRRADVALALPQRSERAAPRASSARRGSSLASLVSGLRSLTRRSRSNSTASQQSAASSEPDMELAHEPYELALAWTSTAPGDLGRQRSCVLRIPAEELERDWRWLAALANAACGLRCRPAGARRALDATREAESVAAPPLLCCMARGQFVQALQLFRARALYANVFFDLQVPYSCAAIRAFNPYRAPGAQRAASPVYPHVTLVSAASAPLVRDTLSAELRVQLASKRGPVRFFSADGHRKRLSLTGDVRSLPTSFESRRSSRRSRSDDDDDDDDGVGGDGGHSASEYRHTALDETEFSRRSAAGPLSASASFGGGGSARAEPFVRGDVVLDRAHEAFASDSERDALRAMLVTLQSLGWRRVDVLFDNVLAHERIIAKRANPAKPADSGIDVVYHVMNTFLV